uniref:Uncharacterized protein n=1 Tax=Craspedostauros australis TaxID=1486917 RepID=A0A7R9ZPY8_9STRA|mmetsp:Transcript_3798/g.10102  ORF Transcript_3798/g.10102 Transcript_3798/m.10102 type:complete len:106 (+) Transcript_3798:607-924(+)
MRMCQPPYCARANHFGFCHGRSLNANTRVRFGNNMYVLVRYAESNINVQRQHGHAARRNRAGSGCGQDGIHATRSNASKGILVALRDLTDRTEATADIVSLKEGS